MRQKIIVYDLETTSVDAQIAVPVLMGFKSSEIDGFQYTTNINEMIDILNAHDVIVGYNSVKYDNVIMDRYGANTSFKINVDLMKILHGGGFGNDLGRKTIVITPDEKRLADVLHKKSLDAATNALGGPAKIGDFDYNLFKVPFKELTAEQQKSAIEYLEADVNATEYIYKYLEDFHAFFRDGGITLDGEFRPFMKPEWVRKKKYLTLSTGSWVYHAICNIAGMDVKFQEAESAGYEGGFVRFPTVESRSGRIVCKDYTSAYPFAYMMGNLFGRIKDGSDGWQGKGVCETIGVYDDKNYHIITRILREVFNQRYAWKKAGDSREYTLKIIINTFYGICGNPVYANLYDPVVAADCTRLVRQWIKDVNNQLTADGYDVLYGDTDSVYVYDPFNDDKRLDESVDRHIRRVKEGMNFPQEDFNMSTDDEIEFMMFVKRGDDFLKKNYLYVTESKKLKAKGLQIVKSNCTPLSKTIFKKYIEPRILENHEYNFKPSQIQSWVETELSKDVMLVAQFYKVKDSSEYASESQLQYQIAIDPRYGPGDYNIVKLKNSTKNGLGINKNYIDVKDIQQIPLHNIDLTKTFNELKPFTRDIQSGLDAFF